MLRLLPTVTLIAALPAAFWWLPLGFAIAAAVLILFLLFLEVFLADIRGRHLLIERAEERDQAPATYWHGFAVFNWYAIWYGLSAGRSDSDSGAQMEAGLADPGGFDAGTDLGGGDAGIDV